MQKRGAFSQEKNPLENMWEISGVEFSKRGYYNILALFLSTLHFVQIVYIPCCSKVFLEIILFSNSKYSLKINLD